MTKYSNSLCGGMYIMTIEEVNKILKDKSMSQKQTNFKIIDDNSKKTQRVTLAMIYQEFKHFKDEMHQFKDEMHQFKNEMHQFKNEMHQFKDYVLDVFQRNNLK